MSKETKTKVKITLVRDMIFKCNIGDKDFYIDETNIKKEDQLGPNAAQLLAHAILGCLSASFIYCLQLRKLSLNDLEAEAEVEISRNKKRFLRVKKINVEIKTKIDDPAARKRADQCKKMFENYCTVSTALCEGINIEVNLNY